MDYRRFFRQAIMLTITTGLLASCSKDNNVGEPEADALIEIIPGAAYTRVDNSSTSSNNSGTITGPIDNSMLKDLTFAFTRRDQSHPVLPQYSYSTEHISATYKESFEENKAELQLSPSQYYLIGGLKTEMQGWYPPIKHEVVSNDYPTVTFNFDGHQDIMISNVLSGNATDIGINKPNLFTFQHQLSQLHFQVTAESEIAAQQWGKITSISLIEEPNTYMYVMLNNPTGVFDGSGTFNVTLPQNGIEIVTGEINQAGSPIMIKPRTISISNDIKLNITTTNNNTQFNLSSQITGNIELKAGHAYNLILNFLQGEITIKLTPADWEAAEGPENVDLAENQPYVISDMNYIVSRNMFGDAEGWIIRDETWTTTPTAESETSIPVILEVATENITDNATLDHLGCPEGWRVPSKTELELIQRYKDKLTKTSSSGSYIPIEGFYWSGTQNAAGATYYIDMATGEFGTASEEDGETHHIRCVRDVEM